MKFTGRFKVSSRVSTPKVKPSGLRLFARPAPPRPVGKRDYKKTAATSEPITFGFGNTGFPRGGL